MALEFQPVAIMYKKINLTLITGSLACSVLFLIICPWFI